jgi:hypothetical protein
MNQRLTTRYAVLTTLLFLSTSLSAHHAARLFETTVPTWVKGTVVRFDWGYPHPKIIVEQVEEDGTTTRWALENSTRMDMLDLMGYTRNSFQVGDPIEACGFAPKQLFAPLFSSLADEDGPTPEPQWLDGAERVITARLLLTRDGPQLHWSHYGPIELCTTDEDLRTLAADHTSHLPR